MAAYAIATISIHNRNWLSEYSDKADALISKYGGSYVVRSGRMEKLEGNNNIPDIFVILEFPSMEQAKAWHADPEYKSLIDIRNKGSDTDFLLVQGV